MDELKSVTSSTQNKRRAKQVEKELTRQADEETDRPPVLTCQREEESSQPESVQGEDIAHKAVPE